MKFRLLIVLISLIFINSIVSSQEDAFLLFGGSGIEEGRSLIQTPSGGYMVAGRTRSIGSGSDDYYLLGLNTQFDVFIDKPYGGPHHDRCQSIISLNDNTYGLFGQSWDYLGGRLEINLTIVDAFGNIVRRKLFYREERDLGLKIIKTNDNGFVMVGHIQDLETFGQMFIMKTDEDLNILWENNFGDQKIKDYAYDVIENEKGYLLIGTYSGFYGMYPTFPDFQEMSDIGVIQLDFNGDTLWTFRYSGDDYDFGYSICQVEGIIYALGATRSEGSGSFDILLLQLDKQGNILESTTYGGKNFEYGYKIIADSDDNLLIVGVSKSDVDKPALYVLKIDRHGSIIFDKKISGVDAVYGYDILENNEGDYVITGNYTISETDIDIFLLRMNKDGDLLKNNIDLKLPNDLILIYPNPVLGSITFVSTNSKEILIESIDMYDGFGRIVKEFYYSDPQFKIRLNLSDLISGCYYLKSHLSNGKDRTNKIIVY